MSFYESSSDEEPGMLKKALDIELSEDFDPTKTPVTGEEYLQYVIYERKQCKKWLTVDIDKSKLKTKPTLTIEQNAPIIKASSSITPSFDWQQQQLKDFILLQKFVSSKTEDEPDMDIIQESHWEGVLQSRNPTFTELTRLKQCAKLKLIHIIGQYLSGISKGSGINRYIGIWIYSILATLVIPLSPSDCHDLRELARKLAIVRSNIEPNSKPEVYVPLNLCICIIARVFGQLDLADC